MGCQPIDQRVLLVTGTDTGVGKTVASAWLARHAPASWRIALVKAVQTGADPLVDGDEAFYRMAVASRRAVTTATLETLPEPLAPLIAARRAGRALDFNGLASRCRAIAAGHAFTIIEGAGGLLVPVTDRADFADLALALSAPVAIVLRPGLGTINHTLLTIESARSRGIAVEMLVCCGAAPDAPAVEVENLRYLRERFPGIPLLVLQWASGERLASLELHPRLLGPAPGFLREVGFEGQPGLPA